jgi:hypothetical protein
MPFADRILHMEDGAFKDGEGTTSHPPAKSLDTQPVRGEKLVHT